MYIYIYIYIDIYRYRYRYRYIYRERDTYIRTYIHTYKYSWMHSSLCRYNIYIYMNSYCLLQKLDSTLHNRDQRLLFRISEGILA